eukprot:TRINITY_DN3491_c0_g1_i1.p1 TRINITY_DN3491_c0_g1~~TRINITY_DN3491_c0_g1_i1.p1  ORF type:complete len:1804 (+),score=408.87 TRINITY_DN3491_c0_g1_i1:93-5504(+)
MTPASGQCAARLAALGILATEVALGQEAWEGVEVEALPDGVVVTENIVLLSVSVCIVSAAILFVAFRIVFTGSARMPSIILAMQLLGVIITGICTWVVTYEAGRSAIEQHASSLLIFAGLSASSRTTVDLGQGEVLVGLMAESARAGAFQMLKNGSHYPETHKQLLGLARTIIRSSASAELIYFGNEHGELQGLALLRDSTFGLTGLVRLSIGSPPHRCAGEEGPYGSCTERMWELDCGSNQDVWNTCRHPACADTSSGEPDGSRCKMCFTHRSHVRDHPTRCPGCVACDNWFPGAIEEYTVPFDPGAWDLPPKVGQESGWCNESGVGWQELGMTELQGYYPNGTAGRRWVGGRRLSMPCRVLYDPRVRPWYARADGVRWSPVYEFTATEGKIEMGITITSAVRNPAYNGADYVAGVSPDMAQNPWLGVLAVDFTFSSLSLFLAGLRPTPNSVVIIADLEGTLCASSLEPEEMTAVHVDNLGRTTYAAVNVTRAENWIRKDLVDVYPFIVRKFGSLEAAMEHRAILMGGDAAVLNQPIALQSGLRWLMAIRMPYEDVTKDAQDAATLALFLAVIISFGSSFLVAVVTVLLLRPLQSLSQQIHDVARMDVVHLPPLHGGLTTEVCRMVASFTLMVASLKKYRSFLPTAILADSRPKALLSSSEMDDSQWSAVSSDVAVKDTKLVPQLASVKTRSALQCIISQTVGTQRTELNEMMANLLRTFIAKGDMPSARHLLECGWDVPRELRTQVSDPRRVSKCGLPDFSLRHGNPVTFSSPTQEVEMRWGRGSTWLLQPPHAPAATTTASGLFQPPGAQLHRPSGMFGPQSHQPSGMFAAQPHQPSGMFAAQPQQPSGTYGQQASSGNTGRFCDRVTSAGATMATVPLFPPEYTPKSPLEEAAHLANWHDPKGSTYWCGIAVAEVIKDYQTCYPAAEESKAALWVYTAEVDHPVVWALWLGDKWEQIPDLDDSAEQSDFKTVAIPMDGPTGKAERIVQTPAGLQVYAVGGKPRALRYENLLGGDPENSPLRVAVSWAPHPDELIAPEGFFSGVCSTRSPPPPGVVEYITSRDFLTLIEQETWRSVPLVLNGLGKLRCACLAQKNQQRPDDNLCLAAKRLFAPSHDVLPDVASSSAVLAVAVRRIYRAKCPAERPTPAQIARATELGLLQWGDQWCLHALTGTPRQAVPLGAEAPSACELWRVDNPFDDQPYFLMNASMRHQQNNRLHAELRVGAEYTEDLADYDPLLARQPAEAPPEPAAAVFQPPEDLDCDVDVVQAQWMGQGWKLLLSTSEVTVTVNAEVTVQAWGLPQYRGIIWYLDHVLRSLPSKPRKGYRGLVDVRFDSSYSRGRVVVFGPFTSTSNDQGVATGFASSDLNAAIFTMYGQTGRLISEWSRFSREQEVLYPPNTLHLVTDALSGEHAAILGKKKLQLFDLRELTLVNAVYLMAREGAIEVCKEHPSVLQLAERARDRAAEGDWVGAARELITEAETTSAADRKFVLPVLPRDDTGVVALTFSSPGGVDELGSGLDAALWSGFFRHTERVAEKKGAQVLATHIGMVLLLIPRSSAQAAERAAVSTAKELLSDAEDPLSTSGHPTSPRREPGGLLQVHVGVSAGTVNRGFAGGQQRVEIADGAPVRRARRMAAYAKQYGVMEMVGDPKLAEVAAGLNLPAWTTDLITFDAGNLREPIICIGAGREHLWFGNPLAAAMATSLKSSMGDEQLDEATIKIVEEGWAAVLEAEDDRPSEQLDRVQECLERLPAAAANVRAVRALRHAALRPATYCGDADVDDELLAPNMKSPQMSPHKSVP